MSNNDDDIYTVYIVNSTVLDAQSGVPYIWTDQPCGGNRFACPISFDSALFTTPSVSGYTSFNFTSVTQSLFPNSILTYALGHSATTTKTAGFWSAEAINGNYPYLTITYEVPVTVYQLFNELISPTDHVILVNHTINITGSANSTNSNLVNATLWHNASGTFTLNSTISLTGTDTFYSINLSNINTDSYFDWNVEVCNDVGNCTFASSNRSIYYQFPDVIPPVIVSDLSTEVISNNYVKLNWSANLEDDFDRYLVYINGTYIQSTGTETFFEFTDYLGDPIVPYQAWNFSVYTVDTSENVNLTNLTGFNTINLTIPFLDEEPPTFNSIEPLNNTNHPWDTTSLLVNLTLGDESTPLYCQYTDDLITYYNFTFTGFGQLSQHDFTVAENTSYLYYYSCYDTYLNRFNYSHSFWIDDNFPPDSVTSVSNVTWYNYSYFTWVGDSDSDKYMVYLNDTFIVNTTDLFYNFTLLNENALYYVNILPVDEQENINTTDIDYYFSTDDWDGEPPSFITDLSNTTSTDSVVLDWTLIGDSVQYRIYRNGSWLDNSTNGSYIDKGVVSLNAYNYSVLTVDSNGNVNTTVNSGNSLVTVIPTGDLFPPYVTTINNPVNNTELSHTTSSVYFEMTTNEDAYCKYSVHNQFSFVGMTDFLVTNQSVHTSDNYNVYFGQSYDVWYLCQDVNGNFMNHSLHSFNITNSTYPTLNQLTPLNNLVTTDNDHAVRFNLTDDHTVSYCTLYSNGTNPVNSTNPREGSSEYTTIDWNFLSVGAYTWYVTCRDDTDLTVTSSTRTITVEVSETNDTFYRFKNNLLEDLLTISSSGNLWVKGITNLVALEAGTIIAHTIQGVNDLLLLGTSDQEFAVGSQFFKQNTSPSGCFDYYLSGNTNITSEYIFEIYYDVSPGYEVGQTRYNWTNGLDSSGTNFLTSNQLTELSNGVQISFVSCDLNDFESGDTSLFAVDPEPELVFRIDTNEPGRSKIESQADWNFSKGDIYMHDGLNIDGDLYVNNISVFNITKEDNEVIWTIYFP